MPRLKHVGPGFKSYIKYQTIVPVFFYKNVKYTEFFERKIIILLLTTIELNVTLKALWGSLNKNFRIRERKK